MKIVENKVAIVTGGASGIGKAIARLLLKEGAKVTITDINKDLGSEAAKELGGEVFFIEADSASPEDSKRVVEETVSHFGALHVAVNNAGVTGRHATVVEYSVADWKKVIDINLNGVFYGMHYQIPEIEKSGGSIINIASTLGSVGLANSAAYSAAKHGVLGLTKTAAWEYGTKGVRINAVGPAFIMTPLLEAAPPEVLKLMEAQQAFNRVGQAHEVAELVLWLASDKSSFATGTFYPIDGGYLAR